MKSVVTNIKATFTQRVRALCSSALAIVDSYHDVEKIDATGTVIEDEFIDVDDAMRLTPDTERRMIVTPKHLIVGGLGYDSDAESPLTSCEGNGKIFHRGRDASRDERTSFFNALGFDADGEPQHDEDLVRERRCVALDQHLRDDPLSELRLRMLIARGRKASDAKEVLCELSREGRWDQNAISGRVFNTFIDVLEATDRKYLERMQALLDAVQDRALQMARVEGALGNPYAVPLDLYEHGGVHYSLSGEGMQCGFDTTKAGAVWVPCDSAIENIEHAVNRSLGVCDVRWAGSHGSTTQPLHAQYSIDQGNTWLGEFRTFAEAGKAGRAASGKHIPEQRYHETRKQVARDYCRGVLEELNAWGSGAVYGVLVYAIDRETGEAVDGFDETECWGHVGSDYAEQALEDEMLGALKFLMKPTPIEASEITREAA